MGSSSAKGLAWGTATVTCLGYRDEQSSNNTYSNITTRGGSSISRDGRLLTDREREGDDIRC